MEFAAAMAVAMAVDALLGWPDGLFARIGHPVTWLGRLIAMLDGRWNRSADPSWKRRTAGVVAALIVIALATFSNQRGAMLARNRETLIFQPLKDPKRSAGASSAEVSARVSHSEEQMAGLIMPVLRANELRLGMQSPALERKLDLVRMIAYAGATWDWARLHYDPAYVAERNLPAPVIDGQMLGALLSETLLDWLGPRAFIRKLNFRLRAMVFAGDTVRCEGEVTALATEEEQSLVTVAQRVRVGDRLVADGSSVVQLPT